jgi:hypothetical protein
MKLAPIAPIKNGRKERLIVFAAATPNTGILPTREEQYRFCGSIFITKWTNNESDRIVIATAQY